MPGRPRVGRLWTLPAVALLAAGFPSPALEPPRAFAFRDGPPAAVTGGFGEDSCHACHFGNPLNYGVGEVALTGFPDR